MINEELKKSLENEEGMQVEGKSYDPNFSVCPCCHSNDTYERDYDYDSKADASASFMECETCGSKYRDYSVNVFLGSFVSENNCKIL